MSDMSGHRPLPPAADHERHDALLVAQLAARDPLTAAQLAEAQRLVSTCVACASLADDLRALSAAVAHESVPPRRRDFTLSPEQADRLAGNRVTRFLRKLSLPTARAFQPAAAGVLSLGLLFVVAGYAWPEGGSVSVQAEPNVATYDETSPVPAAAGAPTAAPPSEPRAGAATVGEEAVPASFAPEFLESLTEHQAGISEGSNQKSLTSEASEPEADGAQREMMAQDATAADDDLSVAQPLQADAIEEQAPGAATSEEAADAVRESAADTLASETVDELQARVSSEIPAAAATAPTEAPVTDAGTLVQPDQGGPEELLVVLGLLLAAGGAGLLLLGWLVRRSRDPLLR